MKLIYTIVISRKVLNISGALKKNVIQINIHLEYIKQNSLTPPLFIQVPVQSHESNWTLQSLWRVVENTVATYIKERRQSVIFVSLKLTN